MRSEQFYIIIILTFAAFAVFNCSLDQVENQIRDVTSGSSRNQSGGTAGVHGLRGKWMFSAIGEDLRLTCYLNPRGKSVSGSCSKEYSNGAIGTLSISDYGSHFYFNLISRKTNRLVANGALRQEQDNYLTGECTLIYPDGKQRRMECDLIRD